MGCDIHMVLERKFGNEWVGLHSYRGGESAALNVYSGMDEVPLDNRRPWVTYKITGRDYGLFAELAGVRGESTMGNEPRGLPDNMSQLTAVMADEYGSDGHSHSHLSLTEFVAAYCAATDQSPTLVEHRLNPTRDTKKWFLELCALATGIDIYDDAFDDFRICFWFDN